MHPLLSPSFSLPKAPFQPVAFSSQEPTAPLPSMASVYVRKPCLEYNSRNWTVDLLELPMVEKRCSRGGAIRFYRLFFLVFK